MATIVSGIDGYSVEGNESDNVFVDETGEYYETLTEAFNDAYARDYRDIHITLVNEGEYEIDFDFNDCDLSIRGDGEKTVVFTKPGYHAYYIKSITMRDLTYRTGDTNYSGFQGNRECYYNVHVENLLWTYGKTAIFENCSFHHDNRKMYCLWCYSTDNLIVNNCKFDGMGRGILIYNESSNNTCAQISDCEFKDSDGYNDKSAIEIHTEMSPQYVVSIDNCTVEGFSSETVCGNPLWNARKGETPSDLSLVIVDGVTEMTPRAEYAASIIGKNGISLCSSIEDALNKVADGGSIVLWKDANLPDFDKNITISGCKTIIESNDTHLTKLTVGDSIPGSTYMQLNVDSQKDVAESKGCAIFKDCDMDVDIVPGEDGATIDEPTFDESGSVLTGIVEFKSDKGRAAAEKALAEGCVLKEFESDRYKVCCTIILDLGDDQKDYIYLALGEKIPDLEKIPQKVGFEFNGLYLGDIEYFNAEGKALVEISELMPNTVLEAEWTEVPQPDPPQPDPPQPDPDPPVDDGGGSFNYWIAIAGVAAVAIAVCVFITIRMKR